MSPNNNNNLFDFYATKRAPIGLLSIPHSGLDIPQEFAPFLVSDSKVQNQDVDYAVDQLVDIPKLQEAGVAVLVARVHRICIDLNRSEDLCLLNWKQNSHGKQLVLAEPDKQLGRQLIDKYYLPYYQMLKSVIENLHSIYPKVSVIDLHSMPSKPTEYHLKINPNQKMTRPNFCVSDISGQSCEPAFINFTCDRLKDFATGEVTQNDPYFGGHVTRHINAQFPYTNNIQIEINRALYMNEEKMQLLPNQTAFKGNLTKALLQVFDQFCPQGN